MGPQGLSPLWLQESLLDNVHGLKGAVRAFSLCPVTSFYIILFI